MNVNVKILGLIKGRVYKIRIDINKAITPPSLLGIDRRIAYANKKYHSGWIWAGVTNGFAGVKLSGSLSIYGLIRVMIINRGKNNINPSISLRVK